LLRFIPILGRSHEKITEAGAQRLSDDGLGWW
jgi:hypothetical protein